METIKVIGCTSSKNSMKWGKALLMVVKYYISWTENWEEKVNFQRPKCFSLVFTHRYNEKKNTDVEDMCFSINCSLFIQLYTWLTFAKNKYSLTRILWFPRTLRSNSAKVYCVVWEVCLLLDEKNDTFHILFLFVFFFPTLSADKPMQ